MSASENNKYPSPDVNQPDNRPPCAEEPIVAVFTYSLLTDIHLQRRAVDNEGRDRPKQSLTNELSVIGDWLTYLKRNSGDAVGEERSEERRVGKECRSRWSTNH